MNGHMLIDHAERLSQRSLSCLSPIGASYSSPEATNLINELITNLAHINKQQKETINGYIRRSD
ncbi:hypothetical protein FQZ97_527040 [compost metagenome]